MFKDAIPQDIELDHVFAIDEEEEDDDDDNVKSKGAIRLGTNGITKNAPLDVNYKDLSTSEELNPFLQTGASVNDDDISARWKDNVGASDSLTKRFCISTRKNACRISVFGLAALLILALGAVLYKNSHTSQSVKISSHWKGFDKIENWFSFGDSWTDNSFEAWGPQPSPENPFGNPDVAGRDVYNYVGYLTLKYNHSLIKTRDMAWSASTIDAHYDLGFLEWLDFAHQVHDSFKKYYVVNDTGVLKGKDWNADNTLFSAFFGINDVFVYKKTNPQWDKVFESYANFLEELYEASARNFLIINLPPIQYAPNSPGDPIKDTPAFRALIDNHNAMLADLVQHLIKKHDDATVFLFDVHSLLQQIIDDPKSVPQTAGIKDTVNFCSVYKASDAWFYPPANSTKECMGLELKEMLWRDELHVTAPVHDAIAAHIEQLLMKYTPKSA